MSLTSSSLMGIIGAIVMFMGTRQILAGKLTLGGFFTYTMFLGYLAAPLFQVVGVGTQITEAIAGLERTREVLSETPEDEDPERTVILPPIRGDVAFEDVTFAYEAKKTVLHNISFHSQPGTVTALVGSSGSGKSTIIGLVAAFHKPNSGRVMVDGIDLATVRLESYRTQLGMVLQDSFLFDGTIRENVSFSKPDATEEELMRACAIARVDEFAEKFELKYDTIIGERGVKLSGGQRQRVSIARAILANPRILILDEATSSLDSESEQLIQQGLSYLMQGRTTFVIAHRLSTIRRADQILVVEAGQIVERGTHQSLYALGGRYYDLYTKQHGLEQNLFLAPGEGDVPEEMRCEWQRGSRYRCGSAGSGDGVGPAVVSYDSLDGLCPPRNYFGLLPPPFTSSTSCSVSWTMIWARSFVSGVRRSDSCSRLGSCPKRMATPLISVPAFCSREDVPRPSVLAGVWNSTIRLLL